MAHISFHDYFPNSGTLPFAPPTLSHNELVAPYGGYTLPATNSQSTWK